MSFGDIYLAALNHLEARRRADAITLLCHTSSPIPRASNTILGAYGLSLSNNDFPNRTKEVF